MVEIGEISSAWGIVPQEVKTVKDNVWRIKAVDGEYALKRSGLSPAKLQFIAEAQNHLTHCGFQYFSHPLFCGGAPFLELEDGIYTLYEWVAGDRCDFDHLGHLKAAAETLARFHLVSRLPSVVKIKSHKKPELRWVRRISTRIEDMERYAVVASEHAEGFFEKMYLAFYGPMMKKASDSRRLLLSSEYPRLEEEARKVGSFIHYDVAARNFIIQDGKAYLIDFDYCARDLPLVDLMRLMKRSLKYGNNAENKLKVIIEGYGRIYPMSKEQWEVLHALLLFPQKYWRLAQRYFQNDPHRDNDFFKKRIRTAVAELEREDQWIKIFRRYTGLEVAR